MYTVVFVLVLSSSLSPHESEVWHFGSPTACYLAGKLAMADQGYTDLECRPRWLKILTSKRKS